MNTHIVKSGEDNLDKIAAQYGLTGGDLAVYNRLPSSKVVPGQELKLELPKDALPIKVKLGKGDSLETVAKHFNTSVDRIKLLNNLKDSNVGEGTSLIAWDPFRMNYTKISKPEDLDTLARQLNTTKDKLLEANPHVDITKVSSETSINIPWQLNRYVEPIKETKTYSFPEPLKIPTAKAEEVVTTKLPEYKEYYKFSTPKPEAKGLIYDIPFISSKARDIKATEYFNNISKELTNINTAAFKSYKEAEAKGNKELMWKLLSYIQNTNKEFERVTGLKSGTDVSKAIEAIKYPEKSRIDDYLTDQIVKETTEKVKKIMPEAEEVGITDDVSYQRYKNEVYDNTIKIENEGITKGYIAKSSDGKVSYTDKADKILNTYVKDNDAMKSLYTSLDATQEFWETFPKDFEACLLTADPIKRTEYQKQFKNKYSDLSLVDQMNPKFLAYNNLYLEDQDLGSKLDDIINEKLPKIKNNDIILEVLTSGNPDSYSDLLKQNNISSNDVAIVGNLLDEYYNYNTKRIALGEQIDAIGKDLTNSINTIQSTILNYDSKTNLQNFFIQGAQPTSKFGEALKGLAIAKHQASQVRGTTLAENIDSVYLSDLFNWMDKYNSSAATLNKVNQLDLVYGEQSNRLFERREEKKLESILPSNWFNENYSDIKTWEKILVPLQYTIQRLAESKNPVVSSGTQNILKTMDYYMNDIVGKTIIPATLKVPVTYGSMILYAYPEYLTLQAQKAMGQLTDEEYDKKIATWDKDLQTFAKLQFGINRFNFNNVSSVFNQLSTSNIVTVEKPMLDAMGKEMVNEHGKPLTYKKHYNEITLWKDWNLYDVLKNGNRLDLYREIQSLNPDKDLTKLKSLDKVILPRIDEGIGSGMVRGSENYIYNPQTFFEKTILNPEQIETVNQLVEIFYDPLTYVTYGIEGLAKTAVSPIRFIRDVEGKALSTGLRESFIKGSESLLTNGSRFTFLSRKIPQLASLYSNLNSKIVSAAEKMFPDTASKWYHIPAKLDAAKADFIAKKTMPTSYANLKRAIKVIDFFEKPIDVDLFRLPGKVSEAALKIKRIFDINYIIDNLSKIKTEVIPVEKLTKEGIVIIRDSNGKQFIGKVIRTQGATDISGEVMYGGKKVKIDSSVSKSFDIQLADGSFKSFIQKQVKEIKAPTSKELKSIDSAWKAIDPMDSYISDFIENNIETIRTIGVVDIPSKNNYIAINIKGIKKPITGKIINKTSKEVGILLADKTKKTLALNKIKEIKLIDPREIKDLVIKWNDTFPSEVESKFLSPLKNKIATEVGRIDNALNWFSAGQLISKLPPSLRVTASDLINRAGFTLNNRAALDTKLMFDYYAQAFKNDKKILQTRVRQGDKYIDLAWNERVDKNGKIFKVEGLTKKAVVENKIENLLLNAEAATLEDWKVLCKYGVYPSTLKSAIEKLAIQISRGDEVSKVLLKNGNFISDLVRALDPNSFNPSLQKVKIRFGEEYTKYLYDNGITSRPGINKIFEIANEYNKKIANTSDEAIIIRAKEEIRKTYGDESLRLSEGIVDIYQTYTKELLQKQRSIIDPFYIDIPNNIEVGFKENKVILSKVDDKAITVKDIFFKRKGSTIPEKLFKAGTKKSEILEYLNKIILDERFDYLQGEKILKGIEARDIIRELYQDAIDNVKNPKIKEIYNRYVKTGENINLDDFISFIETYRNLKDLDYTSFKQIKDVIQRQYKGADEFDKIRLEVLKLLDGKKPFFRNHDIGNSIGTLLNLRRSTPKELDIAAKTINGVFKGKKVTAKNKRFLVLDTETTGTNIVKDNIIEFGWKVIDGEGNIIPDSEGKFYRKYDKDFSKKLLEGDAQKIHGITDDIISKEGQDFGIILDNLINEINNVDGVIAHNADFDIGILREELKRNKISADTVFYGKEIIDTIKSIDNNFKGKSLLEMYNQYVGGTYDAHDALADVNALAQIYKQAYADGKVSKFVFTDNTSSIHKNLVSLKDQLQTLEETRRITPGLGVGEQPNWTATKPKEKDELIRIRKEFVDYLFGDSLETILKSSEEDIVKNVTEKTAQIFDIVDGQRTFKKRKNMKQSDKTILQIVNQYHDKIKELSVNEKRLSKELKSLEAKKKDTKIIKKELEDINNKIIELKKKDWEPLSEDSGIIVIHQDYGSTDLEKAELKRLSSEGYRFLIMSKDYKRFGGKILPAIKALRDLGLAEEFDMTKPLAKGQVFDFYTLNLKSRKLLSGELYDIYSNIIKDSNGNIDYLTRLILDAKDQSKSNLISVNMSLVSNMKQFAKDELLNIDDTIGMASKYSDFLYKYISEHKDWFNNPDIILNELKFIKDINGARLILSEKSAIASYLLKALDNLKENNVDVFNLNNLTPAGIKAKEMFDSIMDSNVMDPVNEQKVIKILDTKFSKELKASTDMPISDKNVFLSRNEYYSLPENKVLELKEWLDLPENKFHLDRIDSSKDKLIDNEAMSAYLSYKNNKKITPYDDYVFFKEQESVNVDQIGLTIDKDESKGTITLKELSDDYGVLEYLDDQLQKFGYESQSSIALSDDLMKQLGAKKIKEIDANGHERNVWVVNVEKIFNERVSNFGKKSLVPIKKERLDISTVKKLPAGIYDDGIILKKRNKNGEMIIEVSNIYNNNVDNKIVYVLSPESQLEKSYRDGDILITSVDQEINHKNYLNILDEDRRELYKPIKYNDIDTDKNVIDFSSDPNKEKKYNIYKTSINNETGEVKFVLSKKDINENNLNDNLNSFIDKDKSYKIQNATEWHENLNQKAINNFDKKMEMEEGVRSGDIMSYSVDPIPESLYDLTKKEVEREKIQPIMVDRVVQNVDTFDIKNLDGTISLIPGNKVITFENIFSADKASGNTKVFPKPKELSTFEYLSLDLNKLRSSLRSEKTHIDYIIVDVLDVKYISNLEKELSTIKDVVKHSELSNRINNYKQNLKIVDKLEKTIKSDTSTIDNISNVKVYRINRAEDIVLDGDRDSVNAIKNHYYKKEKGLIVSDNTFDTQTFFNAKMFSPRERNVINTINDVYRNINLVVGAEKGAGVDWIFSKQSSLFTDTLDLDASLEKLVNNVERAIAKDTINKDILNLISNTNRTWHGKEIVVIGLDNAKYVSREFYEAIDDLKGKNCTFIFSKTPTKLELEMRTYIKNKGLKVKDMDLDNAPVLGGRHPLLKDSDLQKQQDELMKKTGFVLLVGKIDDVGGVIPKPVLISQAARDAGTLVYSDSKIIRDQMRLLNSFFGTNIKEAYKLPGLPLKLELFNNVITPEQALEKAIKASARKALKVEWYKWKTEQVENYRTEIEEKFKELGEIGGETRDLTLAREAIEELVRRFERLFTPIEDNILKWRGKEDSLDKVLRLQRKKLMGDLAYDLATGKKNWDVFDTYLKKGVLPSKMYSTMNFGVKTIRFINSLPGYAQGAFIMFVLRLSPRWYINNAIDDTVKTFLIERNFNRFLSALWLNTRVYTYFGSTIMKHIGTDTGLNRIVIPFYRLWNKLNLMDAKTLEKKIAELRVKKDFNLVEWLSEHDMEDFSKFVDTDGDIILKRKDGSDLNLTAQDRNYYLSAGIQESFTDADEAMKAYNAMTPDNPWKAIKKKTKEYGTNLDYFSAQSERMRRSFVLYRALQNQTIKLVEAKALIKDFFFDYRDINRAVMVMRKFFPFFSFNYFTVKLFLKLLLGKYGYQTFRAGMALMEVWEANTQNLPEIYKDRISLKIGGKEYLIRPNLSLLDVLKFMHNPGEQIETMAENPSKMILGLGYGPVVGNVVNELSGTDYYSPSRSALRKLGWSYSEIEREISNYEETQKEEVDDFDKLYKVMYAIVPQIDLLNNILFKLDAGFEKSDNLLKSKRFREITKLFGINIFEWDAIDKLQNKIFSLPPSIRNYYIDSIKKEDPEVYKEFNRQSLIGLWVKKVNEGASEQEILDAMKERYTQNTYYGLEEEENGKGDEWLRTNPDRKVIMEKLWAEAPTDTRKEYNEKVREAEADRRNITQIIEETIPKNLNTMTNVLKYQALGEDFTTTINRDLLVKDLTNKGLNLKQINTLIANKYADAGVDFIREEQVNQKKSESEKYKNLSLEEKKALKIEDDIFTQKMKVINRFLPGDGLSSDETATAFRRWEDSFDTYLTAKEKQRYLDSLPDSQRILKSAMTDYISRWGKIIDGVESYNYYSTFNSQPEWFKQFYFIAHPDAKIYYPVATERERRLQEIASKMDKGINTTKDRLALEEWFWNQTDAIKAWEKEKPETIKKFREKKDYIINFQVPLQSFANINNWVGYYNFILSPNNSKYLKAWSESGEADRTPEQIKIDAEKKIQIAKASKEFYSLPSKTWEDQKAKQEWLDKNTELREWWDRNKTPQEKELSKKVQQYQLMKFDFDPTKGDVYTQWRKLTLSRDQFLKDNPEVLAYLNKGSADNLESTVIQKKLKIFNSLSTEKQAEYIDSNPDLSEYFLAGVPEQIRSVRKLQDQYFDIKEKDYKSKDDYYDARNSFLSSHKELQKYWDTMSLPASAFNDKDLFNKYQNYLSKINKYFDSVSASGLNDFMRIGLLSLNPYQVPGDSPEDKWLKGKVYSSAMQTWIRLLDDNKSIGMYFFRQLPNWIRQQYYKNHPEKMAMANYSLGNWFGQSVWSNAQNNPNAIWALQQQKRYGSNIPFSISKKVENILIASGLWEDRSKWNTSMWNEWQLSRAAKLNGLRSSDVATNPLIKKELFRASQMFGKVAPIPSGIYKKNIKWLPMPVVLPADIMSGNAMSLLESESMQAPSVYTEEEKPRNLQEQKVLDNKE